MDLSTSKVGFIGAGNMAQALAKGMISSGNYVTDVTYLVYFMCCFLVDC